MQKTALALVGLLVVLAAAPVWADEEAQEAPKRELAPSWRDQGEAAYRAKAYQDAIFLYRKWLEADPRDENTWYNLACCYALAGQEAAALDALSSAVLAGWKDADWPTKDADLASIRDDARFAEVLKGAAARKDDHAPSQYARHHVTFPTIGTYVAMLPPDYAETETAYPLVVILHGNGSTETQHGRISDRLGREGVIYVAPRAPHPHHAMFTGMGKPGWTAQPQDAADGALDDLEPAKLYVDSILATVADARKRYRVAGDRFFVVGHSMGAFYANLMAVFHPTKVASYYAYAGGLHDDYHDAKWLTPLKEHGVKAVLGHGLADPVVSPEYSAKTVEILGAAGVDVTHHTFEGVDHGIQPAVAESMAKWVRETVRAAAVEE